MAEDNIHTRRLFPLGIEEEEAAAAAAVHAAVPAPLAEEEGNSCTRFVCAFSKKFSWPLLSLQFSAYCLLKKT